MIFPVETVLLKDGRACTLRPAAPEDAEAMLRFLSEVSEETAYLLRCADEWTYTREDEEGLLCSILESGKRMMMLAEIDGVIAGNCALNGADKPRRTAHRASLAIAIRRAYWGLGLGTAMIERACRLAPRMGYAQVELGVVEGSPREYRNAIRKLMDIICELQDDCREYRGLPRIYGKEDQSQTPDTAVGTAQTDGVTGA